MNDEKQPSVSIIMPAYNSQNTIIGSINSILSQTYTSFELIIVNDGSVDNTDKIIRDIASKEPKIVYLTQTNQGVSAARNLALTHAKYDFIAFCDADDEWFETKLKQQIDNISDAVWCYTDSFYVGSDYPTPVTRSSQSTLYEGHIHSQLFKENFLTTSSLLIQKKVIEENNKFDETMAALEDWDLWLKIAHKHPIKLVDTPLLNYLVVDGSTSRKARQMLPLHTQLIHQHSKHFAEKVVLDALLKSYLICGYIAENSHDYHFSLYCAWRGWITQPTEFIFIKRALSQLILLTKHYINK